MVIFFGIRNLTEANNIWKPSWEQSKNNFGFSGLEIRSLWGASQFSRHAIQVSSETQQANSQFSLSNEVETSNLARQAIVDEDD